jgi:hypothetical protein
LGFPITKRITPHPLRKDKRTRKDERKTRGRTQTCSSNIFIFVPKRGISVCAGRLLMSLRQISSVFSLKKLSESKKRRNTPQKRSHLENPPNPRSRNLSERKQTLPFVFLPLHTARTSRPVSGSRGDGLGLVVIFVVGVGPSAAPKSQTSHGSKSPLLPLKRKQKKREEQGVGGPRIMVQTRYRGRPITWTFLRERVIWKRKREKEREKREKSFFFDSFYSSNLFLNSSHYPHSLLQFNG